MEKKVLTLTVSKQWFDKIVSGEKTEEYREIKPYWIARLFQNNSNIVDVRYLASGLAGRTDLLKKYIDAQRIVLKQYTHVLFINGYRKDSPRIEKEIESINISKLRLCYKASYETRKIWMQVVEELRKIEPHLTAACVPQCIYRGFCPESKSCGKVDTHVFPVYRENYKHLFLIGEH